MACVYVRHPNPHPHPNSHPNPNPHSHHHLTHTLPHAHAHTLTWEWIRFADKNWSFEHRRSALSPIRDDLTMTTLPPRASLRFRLWMSITTTLAVNCRDYWVSMVDLLLKNNRRNVWDEQRNSDPLQRAYFTSTHVVNCVQCWSGAHVVGQRGRGEMHTYLPLSSASDRVFHAAIVLHGIVIPLPCIRARLESYHGNCCEVLAGWKWCLIAIAHGRLSSNQ